MSITLSKGSNEWFVSASRVMQEADFEIFKKKNEKKRKQMLWKCGAKRFK